MRISRSIPIALCLGLTVSISNASAGCREPTTATRQQFIQQWLADADVIADVQVARVMNLRHGSAELLKILKTYKGTPGGLIALSIPSPKGMISTVESPTTGLPAGSRTFVLLQKKPQGWLIPACSSSFSADLDLASGLRAASK